MVITQWEAVVITLLGHCRKLRFESNLRHSLREPHLVDGCWWCSLLPLFLGVVGVRKAPETAFTRYDNGKQNSSSVNSEFNIRRDRFRRRTKCCALAQPASTPQAANARWN
jgi:hypothetical protein